ncbi:MAG: hypothetical protein FWG10_12620 [Eubacteriaceae bacterium]|nr:hypothetical protein [Eubacteriaceae bacterium]
MLTSLALVIELKWGSSANDAIQQIKSREYMGALSQCKEVLLAGINYDKTSKTHECEIEEWKQN